MVGDQSCQEIDIIPVASHVITRSLAKVAGLMLGDNNQLTGDIHVLNNSM